MNFLKAAIRKIISLLSKVVVGVLILPIKIYQLCLSPFLPPSCRFHPTCSRYALDALKIHGPIGGGFLAVKRIMRCHPWNPGGYDPVPPKRSKSSNDLIKTNTGK